MTVEEVPELFGSRWWRSYARSKLKTDPLYEAVWGELQGSELGLLDVGCGMGLFGFYLRARGFENPFHGVDYDAKKVAQAQRIAEGHFAAMTFRDGDAREGVPDFSGNVTVLDILQFFDGEERERLLRAVAASVAPGGKLIIRNGVKDASWRYRAVQAGDVLAKVTFWMKAGPVGYPTVDEIGGILESEGLEGGARPLWGGTPFNNYLFVYERAGGEGE